MEWLRPSPQGAAVLLGAIVLIGALVAAVVTVRSNGSTEDETLPAWFRRRGFWIYIGLFAVVGYLSWVQSGWT